MTTGDTQVVWDVLRARLRTFVTGRVDGPADADDIVQDVFLRVHQHLPSLQESDRLLPWIYQITRNAIADYYRAPARRRETRLEPNADPASSAVAGVVSIDDPASQADEPLQELAACVRPLIDQLSPKYREALTLVELGGLSQVEAAARLGLTVSGMKARVQRARQQLKARLLACCEIEQDQRGGIVEYAVRSSAENVCGLCRAT